MADIHYTFERFMKAVDILAKSTDTLQDRLCLALQDLCIITAKDIPEEGREKYSQMMRSATRIEAISNEGALAATASKMTDEEALQHIDTILDLYNVVAEGWYTT